VLHSIRALYLEPLIPKTGDMAGLGSINALAVTELRLGETKS